MPHSWAQWKDKFLIWISFQDSYRNIFRGAEKNRANSQSKWGSRSLLGELEMLSNYLKLFKFKWLSIFQEWLLHKLCRKKTCIFQLKSEVSEANFTNWRDRYFFIVGSFLSPMHKKINFTFNANPNIKIKQTKNSKIKYLKFVSEKNIKKPD